MTATKKTTPERGKMPLGHESARRPSVQEPELLRLVAVAGSYGFYRWANVAINVWSSQPTLAAVQVLSELTERSLSACPDGIASVHWLDQGVALPTAEARVSLSELAKRYPKHVTCAAVMLQGSGFWASATRSALTGIMLLAPGTFSLRFFGELGELARFIAHEQAERGPHAVDAARLQGAIEDALVDYKRVADSLAR
jgi:hypothetical protein